MCISRKITIMQHDQVLALRLFGNRVSLTTKPEDTGPI